MVKETSTSESSPIHKRLTGYKDLWAAFLFFVNVVVLVAVVVTRYNAFKVNDTTTETETAATIPSSSSSSILNPVILLLLLITVLVLFASVMGSLLFSYVIRNADSLIENMLLVNIGILVIISISSLISLNIFSALIFGALAGLNYWYYSVVLPRIPFASAVLRTACQAIKQHYWGLLTASYLLIALQTMYMILWTAVAGIAMKDFQKEQQNDDETSNWIGPVGFLLLLSLYWGVQLTHAVQQATVSGTVACWWFQPDGQRIKAVRGSLIRACTTSLGSLCFGSLLIAVIQTLKEVYRLIAERASRHRHQQSSNNNRENNNAAQCALMIVATIARYVLHILERVLEYMTRYAYCYVAAYGDDFITAGKGVTDLFSRRGWTALTNDNLIRNTLSIGAFAFGVVLGLVSAVMVAGVAGVTMSGGVGVLETGAVVGGVMGLVLGINVGMLLSTVVDSAVAMVCVCKMK